MEVTTRDTAHDEKITKNIRDVEERRFKEWENYQKSHRNMEDHQHQCAFIDISIDNALTGRFVVALFEKKVPETVQHFSALLTGEMGEDENGLKLDYYGTSVRSIDKEKGIIVLGDLAASGATIAPLKDENFSVRHSERGMLTMMTLGPNTARTAFGITLKPTPSLDYTQTVFGKIIEGNSLLEKLESLPVNNIGKPLNNVTIALCGTLTGRPPRHTE